MNELVHLNCLKAVKSNAGVKLLNSCAYPGSHCPLHTALVLAGEIKGLSTLIIGTPECTNYSRLVVPWPIGENGELHWMYTLDSNEVVFGCRRGLIDSIHKMSDAGAKAIMIIATCVPELIGEDIEGLVHEVQPKINSKLCHVMLGHFKCNSFPSGSWKTLVAIGQMMGVAEKRTQTVNILGRSPKEEHEPMPSLLQFMIDSGVKLRFLAPGASFDCFMQASDAMLNIVTSPFARPLAEMMKERFYIPFVSLHNSYSIAEIDSAYTTVSQILGISLSQHFEGERMNAEKLQAQVQVMANGRSFVIGPIGLAMSIPIAVYLTELGMLPLLLHVEEWYQEDKEWSTKLLELGHNPPVCHMASGLLDLQVIKKINPDIYIGMTRGINEKILDTVPYIQDLYGKIGYEKIISLMEKVLVTLKSAKGKEVD